MSYGQHMIDLTDLCQQVWSANTLNEKKSLLKSAVNSFKYKNKILEFTAKIDACNKSSTLDEMAANLILNKTDKVVGLLPR